MAQVREATAGVVESEVLARSWTDLLERVERGERVVVEERGRPVAALISARELNRLAFLEAERRRTFKPLRDTRAKFADVPPEEIEREAARATAEVRRGSRRPAEPDAT
jgi:prevent-host-death family protein